MAPLKSKFVGIYFNGLKWFLDIFRKSQQASAFKFDHTRENSEMGKRGFKRDPLLRI
jgi:hypothetical protein